MVDLRNSMTSIYHQNKSKTFSITTMVETVPKNFVFYKKAQIREAPILASLKLDLRTSITLIMVT